MEAPISSDTINPSAASRFAKINNILTQGYNASDAISKLYAQPRSNDDIIQCLCHAAKKLANVFRLLCELSKQGLLSKLSDRTIFELESCKASIEKLTYAVKKVDDGINPQAIFALSTVGKFQNMVADFYLDLTIAIGLSDP
jgi:hypothetical protein